MMIDRLISTGRPGAEAACMLAASRYGIRYTGYFPKGKMPLLQSGMTEHGCPRYLPVASRNIAMSDGVIEFYMANTNHFEGRKKLPILRLGYLYDIPVHSVMIRPSGDGSNLWEVSEMANSVAKLWIEANKVKHLCIVGPTSFECASPAYNFLQELLRSNSAQSKIDGYL